jgi:hypothetical protein
MAGTVMASLLDQNRFRPTPVGRMPMLSTLKAWSRGPADIPYDKPKTN